MKKVLVAGAALLIAGSMVSAANAEVTLSGDARVRYIGQSDYQRIVNLDTASEESNGYYDEFDSRIRVTFSAKAKGGAFMKARLRFDDFSFWDGQGWGAASNNNVKNVWADYAYIGIPMGPVTVTGGRMPGNFSKFFAWDTRPTRVKADWKSGNFRVIGVYDMKQEQTDNALDEWDDNDFTGFGIIPVVKFNDDWSAKLYLRYHDDQREWNQNTTTVSMDAVDANGNPGTYSVPDVPVAGSLRSHADRSGFLGAFHVEGKAAMVGLEAEIAYKAGDIQGTQDDGIGAYVQASLDMGAFVPTFQVGITQDGYQTDPDFGFIMIGADEPITVVSTLGTSLGDSFWAAFTANYAVSDQFKLAGNLVYYDIDTNVAESGVDVRGLVDAIEVSGSATYTISEGADITYKLGYLSPSYDGRLNSAGISDDGYFGHYLRMAIKF